MARGAGDGDPLTRALRMEKVGRAMIAVTIVTFVCITPPVFELVDRLLPGRLSLWMLLVWFFSILCVAVTVERRPKPHQHPSDGRKDRPA